MKKLRRIISMFLICAVLTTLFPAQALVGGNSELPPVIEAPGTENKAETTATTASGTCGENLTWELTSDGTLTISGTGAMDHYGNGVTPPWEEYQESITKLVVESGVTSIGSFAFWGYPALATVSIPDTVTSIPGWAFADCTSLTAFTVDSDNSYYCSVDGVLFNKAKTELIQYPIGNTRTSYTIPDGVTMIGGASFRNNTTLNKISIPDTVTTIGSHAFMDCTALASIAIPEGVTTIDYYTFGGCTSMVSVTIPVSVTEIQKGAFNDCNSLTTVNYSGTEAQWNAITIGDYNDALLEAAPFDSGSSSEDDYTVVTTADELLYETNIGTQKIRLGANITLSGYFANISCSTTLDLNGYTLSAATSENAGCVLYMNEFLSIRNGTVKGSDDGGWAICIENGALVLDAVTVTGGIKNYDTDARLRVNEGSDVDLVTGGIFAGDSSTSSVAIACRGNIDTLQSCTVTYDHPSGGGTGALVIGYANGSKSGTIGSIVNCTFTGSGSKVSGISLFSGSIGYISATNITGSGDRSGLVNLGAIGYIYVAENNYIDSIEGGTIGSDETNFGIWNYGEIGSIYSSTVEGLYGGIENHGEIDSISRCTLIATSQYGRGIEVGEGTIGYITNNTSELPEEYGNFIIVHVDGAVGSITGNTVDAPICNAGKNGGGTVSLIENNTVTTSQSSAIENTGTVTTLGDNTLTCAADGAGVSNSGTINTVTVPLSKLSDTLYQSESGWTLQNDGTINNFTLSEALAAPTLTVGNNASTGKIVVKWGAVDGAEKYELWRSTSKNGTYTKVWTGTKTSLTHNSAEPGETYYYKVRAVAGDVYSAFSDAKGRACDLARPVVTVATNSKGKPVVSWKKVTGAVKYELWRSTSPNSGFTRVWTGTKTSLTHNSAEPGETYYYKVRAICSVSAGNSAYSAVKSVTVPAEVILSAPTLTVGNNASTGKIVVKWGAVDGASKYELWRSTSKNGTYTKVWTGTKTSLTHGSAKPGETYYYKVRAVAGNVYSEFSAVKGRACDLARPVVTVTTNSKGKPVVSWKAVTGAVKYELWRSTSPTSGFTRVWTGTKTSLTHNTAESGVTYYYKVRAICSVSAGNSAYSVVKSVTVE